MRCHSRRLLLYMLSPMLRCPIASSAHTCCPCSSHKLSTYHRVVVGLEMCPAPPTDPPAVLSLFITLCFAPPSAHIRCLEPVTWHPFLQKTHGWVGESGNSDCPTPPALITAAPSLKLLHLPSSIGDLAGEHQAWGRWEASKPSSRSALLLARPL